MRLCAGGGSHLSQQPALCGRQSPAGRVFPRAPDGRWRAPRRPGRQWIITEGEWWQRYTYEGGPPYYEATGVTSGQQHGPTHDSEPPDAVARPSRRRRSRRHREKELHDGKSGTTIQCLGSGWGFFGVGWLFWLTQWPPFNYRWLNC
jgi:hypothetical protein